MSMSTMRNSPQSLMMIVATVSPADIEMTLIKVVAHYRSTQPNMKSSFIDATAGMMPYACDAETPLKKKKKRKECWDTWITKQSSGLLWREAFCWWWSRSSFSGRWFRASTFLPDVIPPSPPREFLEWGMRIHLDPGRVFCLWQQLWQKRPQSIHHRPYY